MVKEVVKKGWQLGLLEGERGNKEKGKDLSCLTVMGIEEKVKISLTLGWNGEWRKVEKIVD